MSRFRINTDRLRENATYADSVLVFMKVYCRSDYVIKGSKENTDWFDTLYRDRFDNLKYRKITTKDIPSEILTKITDKQC